MSDRISLYAEPLSRDAFTPYGDVIECAGQASFPINQGMADRFHDLARVELDENGRTAISLVACRPESFPVPLRLMERHPLASQAFIPRSPQPFLVVVAAPGDPPGTGDLRAFVSNGAQGVNYARGVWHHPMIALDAAIEFIVVDREGPGDNLDETPIEDGPVAVAGARPG